MSLSNSESPSAYDRVAIALHWSVAVLIVCVGAVGLMFGNVLHGAKAFWLNLHGIVGLLLFALVLVRTFWRLTHPAPPLPAGTAKAVALSAGLLHGLMYFLMLAIPAVGLVSFLWHGRVFDFGVFTIHPGITADRDIYRPTQSIHAWMTYALIGALALHIAASLWHQFALRDGLISRMLPEPLTSKAGAVPKHAGGAAPALN